MASRDAHRRDCKECLLTGRPVPKYEGKAERRKRKARQSKPKWQRAHRVALAREATRYPLANAARRALRRAVRKSEVVRARPAKFGTADRPSTLNRATGHMRASISLT